MTQNSTIDHADKMWCKKKDNNREKKNTKLLEIHDYQLKNLV